LKEAKEQQSKYKNMEIDQKLRMLLKPSYPFGKRESSKPFMNVELYQARPMWEKKALCCK
jgi:hypothetical protein